LVLGDVLCTERIFLAPLTFYPRPGSFADCIFVRAFALLSILLIILECNWATFFWLLHSLSYCLFLINTLYQHS
jgi:hypothetical protein